MKITILAVGNKMPLWVNAACADYLKRFGKDVQLQLKEIKPEKRGGSVNVAKGIAAEQQRLMAALPSKTRLLVLDERGTAWSSVKLAQQLDSDNASGQDWTFMIGGADGLSDDIKSKADVLLQLSAMTLPHALVRVILLEQIYRAYSILHKHPYHRE